MARSHLLAGLLAAALMTSISVTPVWAQSPTVTYVGKLTDAKRKPVAGIYPLTFSFYRTPKGGKSVWTESHFVAIDSGQYAIQLGAKRKIPRSVDLERVYVSVAITGGDELLRERLDPKSIDELAPESDGQGNDPAVNPFKRKPAPGTPTGTVEYAETAGRAYLADHAKTADKLGKLSEKELLDQLKKGGGKARLSQGVRYSPAAGGEGGTPFEIRCPPGYVAVGLKGAAGIYLDAIQLLCATFE